MKPFVHPNRRLEAPLEAAFRPPGAPFDEEDSLAPEDAQQLAAALAASRPRQPRHSGGWTISFAAAVLGHVLVIAVLTLLSLRSLPNTSWRVAHGNPDAQAGPSGTGSVQSDRSIADGPSIAALAPSLPTPSRPASMDISIDDSTSLPDRLDLLNVQEVDPVIGLGDSDESQPSPHFASPKRHDVATVSRSTTTPPAPGETAPPHIAGVRGERDGFDSRGLPIPDYPSESQRRGEQGLVIVDVEVLPDGRVGSVHVASDAGYPRLGYAAAQKIKLATFEPAKVNGRPVVGHIRIPYRFTLQ